MKLLGMIALLLTLAACEQQSPDGYQLEVKEYTVTNLSVKVVIHPSLDDLQKASPIKSTGERQVRAWSKISKTGECEMHIVDQGVEYAPQWVGHETIHCMHGRFHPSQP